MFDVWAPFTAPKNDHSENFPVLGIDFGSSNSCIAFWNSNKKRVKVIKFPLTKGLHIEE